jgi:hypothetical protein
VLLTDPLRTRLSGTIDALRATLLDWRPALLVAITAILTLLVAQAPLSYAFNVGVERGPVSDRPFLQSFYPTEGAWPDGLFRWSRSAYATVEVPGVGRRPIILGLTVASHRAQHDPAAPATILTLRHAGEAAPPSFALRREAAHYLVLMPPAAQADGALRLQLSTPVWQGEGDSRDEIGVALAQRVRLWSLRPSGATLPDRGLLVGLPLGVLLLWGAARISGFGQRMALLLALPAALALPLLGLLDAPRSGFLGPWLPQVGLLLVGGAAVGALLIPRALAVAGCPAPPSALRWLILLTALIFALKYGGRLYPESMPGDWQLHINRFMRTVFGDLAIRAQHRGLPFPFPQGYYLDIAPLILTGVEIRPLLPLLAGLFEALSVPVIYALLAGVTTPRLGLLAAAIYALTAHGFMNTWFSFHTQVSTQFFTALLALILVRSWPHYDRPSVWWPILMLLGQQFMGHIGTLINAALLGALAVALLWWRARDPQERRAAQALALAGASAFSFAMLFSYTQSSGLIVEQIMGVASQGLVEVSGKRPIPPATHLQVLWEGGLITHYGFFAVLLAIPGALWIARRMPRSPLPILIFGTCAVSVAQGLLPLATQSAIMTRWLTFAAWAIAVAGAAGLALWWRRGRAARVAGLAMAGYALWITALIFSDAMTQRLPPIEPF